MVMLDHDDALSNVLERLCVHRWQAGLVDVPRGIPIGISDDLCSFYVVVRGSVTLTASLSDGACPFLEQGDFVVLPLGTGHRFGEPVVNATLASGDELLVHPHDTESQSDPRASLIHGHFPLASLGKNPFVGVLPELIHMSAASNARLAGCRRIVDMISEEQHLQTAGWRATVSGLVQLLFLCTVRAYLMTQTHSPTRMNWLHAATDTTIGPVLAKIHAEPDKPWTVNSLTKHTNMAKSAFSERFRQVVGEPPLVYLTELRMQKACDLLSQSEMAVKEISARVGYASASSFCNAFKRIIGKSPVQFRADNRDLTIQMRVA